MNNYFDLCIVKSDADLPRSKQSCLTETVTDYKLSYHEKMYSFPGIKKRIFFSLLILFSISSNLFSQTIIINEVSNGPSGNKEYIELVVVDTTAFYNCGNATPPCIDIRGWILDDNSGYHGSGGIAAGANRFSQDPLWSCVPLGTIILVYNDADVNADIPALDIALNDGNCRIIAPISNTSLFETNTTTPGALACSYPPTGWIPGGDWASTLLANSGDCARIVDINGCEVFSLCWAAPSSNTLIYFNSGLSGSDNVWFFNDGDPSQQINWSEGCADITTCGTNEQTPGAPNNLLNQNFIAQFNNNCLPITPIIVTTVSTDAGCTCDGTAEANATGSIPTYTYEWYDATFSNLMGSGFSINGLCAGTYHVIATSQIDCSDTSTIVINSSGSVPVLNASADPSFCEGDTVFLFSDFISGYNYSWTGPNGFVSSDQNPQILNASAAAEGTYTVIVSDGNCSSAPVNVIIDIISLPLISVSSNSPVCIGDTLFLFSSSSGANSFSWSGPNNYSAVGNDQILLNATLVNGGTYTITVAANGCSDTAQINVLVTTPTNTQITSVNPLCANDSPISLTADLSGGIWLGNGITDFTNGVFDPSTSGIGTHQIIYSFLGNCMGADTIQITVHPLPNADAGNDISIICDFNSVNLNGSNSNGNSISFLWNEITGSISSGAQTASPIVVSSGEYILEVTDVNGCTDQDSVNVLFLPGPDASFTATPSTGTLPFQPALNNTSAGNGLSYEWTTCEGDMSTALEPVFVFDSSGICFIQLVVTDNNGCTDTTFQSIEIFDPHSLYVPNIFTPNADSSNDFFQLSGEGIDYFRMDIFNRWGELLFSSNSILDAWNGEFEGKQVPEGTYYFILKVEFMNGDAENLNGSLTLIRN